MANPYIRKIIKSHINKLIAVSFFLSGCQGLKNPSGMIRNNFTITADERNINQEIQTYLPQMSASPHLKPDPAFQQKLFRVWDHSAMAAQQNKQVSAQATKINALKVADADKPIYGPNLRPYSRQFLAQLSAKARHIPFLRIQKPGVIVIESDIRGLPTGLPLFNNPAQAGEGYPFDTLQRTRVAVGTPVWLCYYSADRTWVYVITPFTAPGWVPINQVAEMQDQDIKRISQMPMGVFYRDRQAVYNHKGEAQFETKLGSYLPLSQAGKLQILYPVKRGRLAQWEQLPFNPTLMHKAPLPFTAEWISKALPDLIHQPYGWGTYLGNRDCSAFVEDFYALFGVFLARNSAAQINSLQKQDLHAFSKIEKKRWIRENGRPFETILYCPGHIVIYVGTYQNEPIILHSPWGVRLQKGQLIGRDVIGKNLFTTLEYGKELPFADPERNFLQIVSTAGDIGTIKP